MRLKVIDAAWIADKALDDYARGVICGESASSVSDADYRPSFVSSSASKAFDDVYERAVDGYYRTYDKVVVVVDCFPMMRVNGCGLMTRYDCGSQRFLRSHGISPQQFLDFFEKFVQRKCHDGVKTDDGCRCVWLKDKVALFDEWKSALLGRFGSSLCDFSKDGEFAMNPNFISRCGLKDVTVKPLSSLGAFRMRKIVEKIA